MLYGIAIDSEFPHAGTKRAGIDVEDGRGAISPFDAPICFLEHVEDMVALQVHQGLDVRAGRFAGFERRIELIQNLQ